MAGAMLKGKGVVAPGQQRFADPGVVVVDVERVSGLRARGGRNGMMRAVANMKSSE
jgi:hypothetical protein